jgi:hypothetical protein
MAQKLARKLARLGGFESPKNNKLEGDPRFSADAAFSSAGSGILLLF